MASQAAQPSQLSNKHADAREGQRPSRPARALPGQGKAPSPRVRVLLVEDDWHYARVLRQALARYEVDLLPVPDLASARRLLNDAGASVDAVLLEPDLPDGRGEDLLGQIEALPNQPGIVVFSDASQELRTHAATYRVVWAPRFTRASTLAATLRLAARGYADDTLTRFAGYFRLTRKEAEVLDLVAKGISPKRIALEHAVSLQAVYANLARVSTKAECASYQEVIAKLFRFSCHGLGHGIGGS